MSKCPDVFFILKVGLLLPVLPRPCGNSAPTAAAQRSLTAPRRRSGLLFCDLNGPAAFVLLHPIGACGTSRSFPGDSKRLVCCSRLHFSTLSNLSAVVNRLFFINLVSIITVSLEFRRSSQLPSPHSPVAAHLHLRELRLFLDSSAVFSAAGCEPHTAAFLTA